MNQIENFYILLQRSDNQSVYFPGEYLIGIISFRLRERLSINSVRILIDGSSRVKWIEGKGRKKKLFGSVSNHLREKQAIFEKGIHNETILEAGEHSFPFKFSLPLNLPTSFECENARIRYSLIGTIDLATSHKINVTRAFTVIRPFDLKSLPRLREASEAVDTKTVSCIGLCNQGVITGELHVKKTGFVPGETIKCNASINNRSSRVITKPVTISLVQRVFCHGRRFSSHIKQIDRDVVISKYSKSIASRSHVDLEEIRLQIPPVCPSTSPQESCVVEIFYALVLRFQSTGMKALKEVSIPVVIGSKPTSDSNHKRSNENAGLYFYQPCVFEPAHSDLLPIEYEENIMGQIAESNAKTFRPVYPYYVGLSNY